MSMLDESLDLPIDKEILINFDELDEVNIIAVISIFIRQDPHCNETSKGICQNFVQLYSMDEFKSHEFTKGKVRESLGQISPQIRH